MTDYIITEPETLNEIVSLTDAKLQLRIEDTYTDEDTLITAQIDAAVRVAEDYINGHIYEKTLTLYYDAFPEKVVFEAYPIRSVTEVAYIPVGETNYSTMDTALYYVTNQNSKQKVITFKEQPDVADDNHQAIKITVAIGYAAGKVPPPIIAGIKLILSDLYEHREDRAEIANKAAHTLMRAYRKPV